MVVAHVVGGFVIVVLFYCFVVKRNSVLCCFVVKRHGVLLQKTVFWPNSMEYRGPHLSRFLVQCSLWLCILLSIVASSLDTRSNCKIHS